MSSQPEPSQPPTATDKPDKQTKPRKPYRGKQSQTAHDDKFRKKAGTSAMAANDARLDKSLFSNLSHISTRLQSFSCEPQTLTTMISQTTRGIGFVAHTTCDWMNMVKPGLGADPKVLYRVGLAYHRFVMMQATPDKSIIRPTCPYVDLTTEPFLGFSQTVMAHPNTTATLAAVLSSFGKVDVGKENFLGFLPQPAITYAIPGSASGSTTTASTSKRKTKRSKATDPPLPSQDNDPGQVRLAVSSLNPYTVHLGNLRSVVTQLANPNVPLNVRTNFLQRNPIPGVIVQNFVLQNPDDIIPMLYTQAQMAQDFRRVTAWIDILHKKEYLFAQISTTGKANPGMLVNSAIQAAIVSNDHGQTLEFGTETHVTSRTLPSTTFLTGIIGLSGELPDPIYQPSIETYGFRRTQSATQVMDASWPQLLDSVLQRQ